MILIANIIIIRHAVIAATIMVLSLMANLAMKTSLC